MRIIHIITFFLLLINVGATSQAFAAASCEYGNQFISHHYLLQGKIAAVSIERAIYQGLSGRYFAGIKVANLANSEIGFDLSDFFNVIHPNQWGFSLKDHREEIDEERSMVINPDDKTLETAKSAFNHGLLSRLPAHQETTFYRQFDGAGPFRITEDGKKFFIVSFDGWLSVTDGKQVENLSFGKNKGISGDAVFPLPLCIRNIPRDGLILQHE